MAIVEKYVGAFSACQTVDWKKDKEEFRTFYLLSIAIFGSSVAHAGKRGLLRQSDYRVIADNYFSEISKYFVTLLRFLVFSFSIHLS